MTPEKDQLHKELSDFMRGTGCLPFDAIPDELDNLEGIQKLVVKVESSLDFPLTYATHGIRHPRFGYSDIAALLREI